MDSPEDLENKKKAILLIQLNALKKAIQKGDLKNIKEIIHTFHENLLCNKDLLAELYRGGYKCVTQTVLIIAACSHKQGDILYYLLNVTDVLDYLTDASFNVKEVDKQKTAALCKAIRSGNFDMVEMLYDYWCSDTHWFGNDINSTESIKTLGRLLKRAHTNCQKLLIKHPQLLVNVHCLITFNAYQHTLYTELNKLKPKDNLPNDTYNEAKAIGTMLLEVLRIYDKYSDLGVVRLAKSTPEDELALKSLLEDESTVYFRGFTCIMYEIYFRKLDFSVTSLILENLNLLRWHLKERLNQTKQFLNNNKKFYTLYTHVAQLYGEVECTVYHYIYRITEDWRLYLPEKRSPTQLKNCIGFHNGKIINGLVLQYDQHKLDLPVIFFEQRNFKTYLGNLKKIIEEHVISKDPAFAKETVTQNQSKKNHSPVVIFIDDNYLKQTEYMRDYYSLKKIVYYIEAIVNASEINVLMVERALQVIGEMLKSTDASYHLSPTTKALLQTAVSVETITHLHNIRKYLSKVDEGQLTRRIDVDIADSQVKQIFDKVKEDLEKIKQSMNPVIDIYKSILDKSLLEKGFSLLDERIKELPYEARQLKNEIYGLYKKEGRKLFKKSNQFMQKVWKKTDLTTQLLKEIPWILGNMDLLLSKQQETSAEINSLAISILTKYIPTIKGTLELITENNKNVFLIKNQFGQYNDIKEMPDYPEKTHITNLKHKLDELIKKNNNIDPDLMRRVNQIKDYSIHWESIKNLLKLFLDELKCEVFATINFDFVTKDSLPDIQTVDNIHKLLTKMETICLTHESAHIYPGLDENYTFDGIEKLDKNIFINSNKTKRDELILCLSKRVGLLKKTLEYSNQIPLSLSQHLLRYKHDQEFRMTLEILLGDIANILAHCKIRLMHKSDKLLTGVDLGNVLDHGNPFVDVIGDVLNSHDFAAELLSKAMMFAEDGESIAALYELFKDNMDPEIIKLDNPQAINDNQKKLFDQFKMSARWKSYLNLLVLDVKNK